MTDIKANISKLKEVRKEKRLWQDEVATAIGISTSNYSLIERGERGVKIETAKKLALFFDMTIDELFFN